MRAAPRAGTPLAASTAAPGNETHGEDDRRIPQTHIAEHRRLLRICTTTTASASPPAVPLAPTRAPSRSSGPRAARGVAPSDKNGNLTRGGHQVRPQAVAADSGHEQRDQTRSNPAYSATTSTPGAGRAACRGRWPRTCARGRPRRTGGRRRTIAAAARRVSRMSLSSMRRERRRVRRPLYGSTPCIEARVRRGWCG